MKLNANATFIKIPLAQIRETGNVRHEYDEDGIKELAESIRNNGLLNPISVKPAQEDENGEKTYELIAGHRRLRAYKYLCEQGNDFSIVECCIRTGNKLVLQIIENLQRVDITPREKEDAIAKMLEENYSQVEIARELSKPIQWVSDIVAGAKVRKIADEASLNTEGIATKTLSQLRSIPEEELAGCLEQLVAKGGTTKAATEILHEWKGLPEEEIPATNSENTTFESSHADTSAANDFEIESEPDSRNEHRVMDLTHCELNRLKPTTHKSSSEQQKSDDDKERRDLMILSKVSSELSKLSIEKICIKDCGKVSPVTGFELRVNEGRIVFLSQSPDAKYL